MDNLNKIRRYELKYFIDEGLAERIRDHISGFCRLDIHVPAGNNSYLVNNLYFDTADLRFYYDTKYRKLPRFKARARFYGEQFTDHIWPELKYKQGRVVWKIRERLTRAEWQNYFKVQLFPDMLREIQPALGNFREAVYWFDAKPTIMVRYSREPYVSLIDNYARITFDRQLRYWYPVTSLSLDFQEKDSIYYDDPVTARADIAGVILEIKVETLIPKWVVNLIRKFNLVQRPFSKYCYSIDHVLEYRNCLPRQSIIWK